MSNIQRKTSNKLIAGVCGGVAEQINVDLTIVRIVTVILGLMFPWAIVVIYTVAWLLLSDEYGQTGIDVVRRQIGKDGNAGPSDSFRSDF